MSVEQWMRYGQARACDPNLIEGCKMQDMKKQEPKKRLDVTDVLWVVILTMQTTFLGAAVYQSAWPEGLEWVGMLLFLGSAAVLCSAIRWAWRKKSAAEVAAQEMAHALPDAKAIAWWRKVLFWSVTLATIATAAEFGDEIQGNMLVQGALLLTMYFGMLWLIRTGRLDWILRKLG